MILLNFIRDYKNHIPHIVDYHAICDIFSFSIWFISFVLCVLHLTNLSSSYLTSTISYINTKWLKHPSSTHTTHSSPRWRRQLYRFPGSTLLREEDDSSDDNCDNKASRLSDRSTASGPLGVTTRPMDLSPRIWDLQRPATPPDQPMTMSTQCLQLILGTILWTVACPLPSVLPWVLYPLCPQDSMCFPPLVLV